MKARSDIGQGKKNTCIIKYTLLCKFLCFMKLCKCKLLVIFRFTYSWKKWFYFMIYKVYCKQVKINYSFGAWNELIFFTLFILGNMIRFSNNLVFEQLSRTNCVRNPRFAFRIKIPSLKDSSSVAAAMLHRLVCLEVRRGVFKIKSSALAVSYAKM